METLYRKYRSQTFGELVGQKQATQILRNAIRRQRLSHAYLFCGPRGTGKTSVARIFAKALCCLDPQDGDCCGKCSNCLQVANGQALDVQEIDAASKNKVDDIRELRDKVGYAPAQFPYKVYIIDEVHMVTPQGFNALLKTLEEPPAHVKFLLCTTEAHKLPVTILSRCIRLDFTRIALPELAVHLQWIAGKEGFALEEDAALELSALAEGSARDAISLLDQLTVYCEGSITRAAVRELFQLGDPELIPSIVKAIAAGQQRELLDTWERLVAQGADAGRFLLQVAAALKDCYIEASEPGWRRALEAVWEGLNLLKQESFPALLVELCLLQAAEAYASPEVAMQDGGRTSPSDGQGKPTPLQQSGGGSSKPEFLRRIRSDAPAVIPEQPPASMSSQAVTDSATPVQKASSSTLAHPAPQAAKQNQDPALAVPQPLPPLTVQDHGPDYRDFLAALKQQNMPAYILAACYAQPEPAPDALGLAFDPDQAFGRAAANYAVRPELLQAFASAAAMPPYAAKQVRVGLRGIAEGWKASGSPFDRASRDEDETDIRGLPEIFARKAGKAAPLQPSPEDAFTEQEPDIEEIAGMHGRSQTEPAELVSGMEALGKQIDKAATPTPVDKPATVEDVLELFGGRILDE